MNRLSLRMHPDPVLSAPCAEVLDFGPRLSQLAAGMMEAMREHGGVGLAANQVGVSLRLLVISGALAGERNDLALANPRLLGVQGECLLEEGCLSLPGLRQRIAGRAHEIEVEYQGLDGQWQRRRFEGLGALCVQHEMDHLDGLTMLDRLSPLKAARAKAKLAKARRGAR